MKELVMVLVLVGMFVSIFGVGSEHINRNLVGAGVLISFSAALLTELSTGNMGMGLLGIIGTIIGAVLAIISVKKEKKKKKRLLQNDCWK